MPDTTENNLADSLGLEVDALLADMAAACDRLQEQLGDPSRAVEPAPLPPVTVANPEPVSEPEAPRAEETLSNDDLSSLVAEMNREAPVPEPTSDAKAPIESAEAEPAESVAESSVANSISNGDLSAMVTDMLKEEHDTPALEPDSIADAPEPAIPDLGPSQAEGSEPTAVVESPVPILSPPVVMSQPEAPIPEAVKIVPSPPEATAVDEAKARAPQPVAAQATHEAHEPIRHLSHRVKSVVLATGKQLEPHALRAASAMTMPVAARARGLIDTIGWVGMYTMFLGVSLWVYIKVIHKPASPLPLDPAVKLAEEHAHQGEAGEVVRHSVERQADHTSSDAKEAAGGHGEAKKDAGHGEKKPAAKKERPKPVAQIPKATKPGEKKKAEPKKDDGHGGGGH